MISHEGQENGGRDSGDGQVRGFCRPKKHVISHDRQEIGVRDSGESQVRGLIDRRKIRGGPPPWVPDSLHPHYPWTEHGDWRTRR